MATYLLIHGAWHNKSVWGHILPLFPSEHTVASLDLPGHGDNQKAFDKIYMQTYVDYVINTIHHLNDKVILVGHSMAGMIISQVAEMVPELIERLVYVSAFVPAHAENLLDIGQKFSQAGASTEMVWDKTHRFIDLKQRQNLQDLFYNACNKNLAHKAMQLLTPEPMLPFFDRMNLSDKKFGQVKKQYIECLKDNTIPIKDQRIMQNKIMCSVSSIKNADHSPFYSTPFDLVQSFLVPNI